MPVITTNVGGLAETVIPGRTGMVVPPEQPAALSDAIVEYFERGLATSMREGVAELRRAHSWEILANETVGLIDELAPTRGWR